MGGAIAGIVGNAIDAVGGSGSSRPKLQDFIEKFTNPQGRYIDTPDPLGFFKVKFKFFPTLKPADIKNDSTLGRLGGSLLNSAINAGINAANNITGGITASFFEGGSIEDAKQNFADAGKHSFMEYLASANLLQGGEQWQSAEQANCPLVLDLSPYVQTITAPNIQMGGEGKTTVNYLGEFPINGNFVYPNGSLQMEVVNTKASICERIFYPWLREVTLPYWSYESQPYTTAQITIDFTSHNDCQYVFCGCRPNQITSLKATQDADSGNLERNVTFMYDFMFITSDLKVQDSLEDKLMDTAGALLGGGGGMINL